MDCTEDHATGSTIKPQQQKRDNDEKGSIVPNGNPIKQNSWQWGFDQLRTLEVFQTGCNLFVTGKAGTGKSQVLREMIAQARKKGIVIAITASTGIAALQLDSEGQTIHSWAGVGFGNSSVEKIVKQIYDRHFASFHANAKKGNSKKEAEPQQQQQQRTRSVLDRWQKTQILFIDEISMLSPGIFTTLDLVGRKLRQKPNQPFGGLQLVLCGDFAQIPPVTNDKEKKSEDKEKGTWVFECSSWAASVKKTITLREPFRQKNSAFVALLDRVREGKPSAQDLKWLQSRVVRVSPKGPDGLPVIFLHPVKIPVNTENAKRLDEIKSQLFESKRTVFYETGSLKEGKKELLMAKHQTFLERAYEDFAKSQSIEDIVMLKVDALVMVTKNIPALKLANGMRGIVTEIRTEPNHPELVVAVTVKIHDLKSSSVVIPVSEWVKDLSEDAFCPLRCKIIVRQIPLMLAWAITIHKAQGQTLDGAFIGICGKMQPGQAYTALSRVKDPNHLWLQSFYPKCITVDPLVHEYHQTLLAFAEKNCEKKTFTV
jgi:ATP-dependent DNA helicase PIF1